MDPFLRVVAIKDIRNRQQLVPKGTKGVFIAHILSKKFTGRFFFPPRQKQLFKGCECYVVWDNFQDSLIPNVSCVPIKGSILFIERMSEEELNTHWHVKVRAWVPLLRKGFDGAYDDKDSQ